VSEGLSQQPLDSLLQEVLLRVEGILDDQERWRLLLDAVVTMAADFSVDELMQRIVRVAADLSGARYAALGVLDEDKPGRLRLFVTHGLNEAEIKEIGPLPTGHGLLGLIIEHPQPLRLHDIAEHPTSYGFPPNHPPMTSFLGVPVRTRDTVFGNLYLTDKTGGGDFTEEDERIVVALAAAAGVAVENARLHEEAHRRESWLTATAEITAVLSRSRLPSDALQVIADRARALSQADVAWMVAGDGELVLEAVSGATADPALVAQLEMGGSLAHTVAESGEPATVDDFSTDPRVVDLASILGWPALGPVLMVPLRTRSGTIGVLALGWTHENRDPRNDLDPALPRMFAEQTALALEVARSRRDEQRLALFEDRDRIARDLHDLVIQRLFAAGLSLQAGIRAELGEAGQARIDNVVDELDATIREIRGTIFALSTMDRSGSDVQSEIMRIVDRSATTLSFRPTLRIDGPLRTAVPQPVATDLLAVLAELLSNAARHAQATQVDVQINVGSHLRLVVTDNGIGLSAETRRSGLANVAERAQRWDGRCEVSSGQGTGTTITWAVPLQAL
jgi:signal transduction histidine kinase